MHSTVYTLLCCFIIIIAKLDLLFQHRYNHTTLYKYSHMTRVYLLCKECIIC